MKLPKCILDELCATSLRLISIDHRGLYFSDPNQVLYQYKTVQNSRRFFLWQDRPHGAKCLTDDRLRLIFCTGTKPTKLLGFVLIQNPIADSGTLTKLDADRL